MVCDKCGCKVEEGEPGFEVINRRGFRVNPGEKPSDMRSGDVRMCALCVDCGCTWLKQITSFVTYPDRVTIGLSDRRLMRALHTIMRALHSVLLPKEYVHLEITETDVNSALVELTLEGPDEAKNRELYTIDLVKGTLSPIPAKREEGERG